MRAVWLGLFLMVCLAALGSFKLAFSPPHRLEAAEAPAVFVSDQEMGTVATSTAPETLTKGDRLQITWVQPKTEAKAIDVNYAPDPPSVPEVAAAKIISRHWHDPSDQKVAQTRTKKPKLKQARHS